MENTQNNKDKQFKSGFVAILGRPNAGKSTLVNKLMGEKVSIVSPKPQTTRNKISAILTGTGYQIIFEDTPGTIKSSSKLSQYMQKSIESAGAGTDVVIVMIDACKGLTNDDTALLEKYNDKDIKLLCLVNKTDEAKPEQVMPILKYLSQKNFKEVIPISAKTGENVDIVLKKIVEMLPQGEKYYPEDMLTDKTERFMAAEIIREKMLYLYQQEIPHGIGINITKYHFNEEKDITEIDAEIFCEKEGHKAIIIGKNGEGLKRAGAKARMDLQKMTGGKVFLSLWVKVKKDWRDSDFLLNELGYNKKEL